MDGFELGLGVFLKMVEEYFGRRLTRALLALIGTAIAVGCLYVIWTYGIWPLTEAFRDLLEGSRLTWAEFRDTVAALTFSISVVLITVGLLGTGIIWFAMRPRLTREARDLLKRADERLRDIRAIVDEHPELLEADRAIKDEPASDTAAPPNEST